MPEFVRNFKVGLLNFYSYEYKLTQGSNATLGRRPRDENEIAEKRSIVQMIQHRLTTLRIVDVHGETKLGSSYT